MLYILLSVVLFSTSVLSSSVEFNYGEQAAWDNLTNSQCGYTSQSPINVITDDLESGDEIGLTNLVFSYLEGQLDGTITNNGHSITFEPSEIDVERTVETYRGTYELLQFHFHWGANNDQGSEHRVDSNQYSGELHFVHKTTSTSTTGTDFDYYTVVGVLLQGDDDLSATGTIWETFSTVPEYEETLNITDADTTFNDLLPSDRTYYYYNGSLTTPLCNQIVQWVLLKTPLTVPGSFLTAVRTVQTKDGEDLTYNFRSVQALNGRKIYDSAANVMLPTVTVMFFSFLVATAVSFY